MEKYDFLPVILGTDSNAYGMAKAFHEAYGLKSLVVGQGELFTTTGSKILNTRIFKNFVEPTIFVESLLNLAKELKSTYKKLILIASSDGYVELIVNHKEILSSDYVVPFIDRELMETLNSKEGFYETCEKHQLDYPKTRIVTKEAVDLENLPFGFPVVLKPSDSMRYFDAHFEGKKKAYIIDTYDELTLTIQNIYASSYDKSLILQEYISGDDSAMRVLNCVSGKDGKVKLMCLGQPLLEDCTPSLIGNYTAIIDDYDEEIFAKYKHFLEAIGYIGYSNFDMKYDIKDNKYKVFEINLRQGRSSYFVTGSGYNQAKYLVDGFLSEKKEDTVYANSKHLWLGIPKSVLLKYLENDALKKRAKQLIKEGKTSTTLYYKKDIGLKRLFRTFRYYHGYVNKFNQYFVKKQ